MQSLSSLSEREFLESISRERTVHVVQVFHLFCITGAVMYALFVALVAGMGPEAPAGGGNGGLLAMLTVAHVFVLLLEWPLAFLLFRWRFESGHLRRLDEVAAGPQSEKLGASKKLHRLFVGAYSLRTLLLASPALLGSTVCLLGVGQGEIRAEPVFWLNLGSTVALTVVGALLVPTRERLAELYRGSVVPALRSS